MKFSRREAFIAAGLAASAWSINEGLRNLSESQELLQTVLQKSRDTEQKRRAIIAAANFPDREDYNLASQIVRGTGHSNACESEFAKTVEPIKLPPSCAIIAQQKSADEQVRVQLEQSGVNRETEEYGSLESESNAHLLVGTVETGSGAIVALTGLANSRFLRSAIVGGWRKIISRV